MEGWSRGGIGPPPGCRGDQCRLLSGSAEHHHPYSPLWVMKDKTKELPDPLRIYFSKVWEDPFQEQCSQLFWALQFCTVSPLVLFNEFHNSLLLWDQSPTRALIQTQSPLSSPIHMPLTQSVNKLYLMMDQCTFKRWASQGHSPALKLPIVCQQ